MFYDLNDGLCRMKMVLTELKMAVAPTQRVNRLYCLKWLTVFKLYVIKMKKNKNKNKNQTKSETKIQK